MPSRMEETLSNAATAFEPPQAVPCTTCAHSRLIEDIRTAGGKRTGKVRCLECGDIFKDPHQNIN